MKHQTSPEKQSAALNRQQTSKKKQQAALERQKVSLEWLRVTLERQRVSQERLQAALERCRWHYSTRRQRLPLRKSRMGKREKDMSGSQYQ
jgi:hypothetical protein